MSRVTGGEGFLQLAEKLIAEKCAQAAEEAAELALQKVFETTPVEDGHAHRAWLSGGLEAIGGRARQALAKSGVPPHRLSKDMIAVRSGHGRLSKTKLQADVTISNDLDFVEVLEFGGVLRPIEPGGRKLFPVHRPPEVGPLYGPRSSMGRGMLVWTDDTGRTRMATSKRYAPGRHVGRAMNFVKNAMGGRRRRGR